MLCRTKVDLVDSVCLLGHQYLHARFLSSSHGHCHGLLAEIVSRMCGVFSAVRGVRGCNAMSVALEVLSGSRLRVRTCGQAEGGRGSTSSVWHGHGVCRGGMAWV